MRLFPNISGKFMWLPAALLALWLLSGCGSNTEGHVSGRVFLGDQLLSRGDVSFHGEQGPTGYGSIQANGVYHIQTTGKAGLKPGEYQVTVVALTPYPTPKNGEMPMPGKSLIPTTYGSIQTSPLKFKVVPGPNTIDLKLTK